MLPTILGLIVGFLPVAVIIVLFCVLYLGADPQDGISYDTSTVRCKALARKLRYYEDDIRYLLTYMNIILPLMTGYMLYNIIYAVIADDLAKFIVSAAALVLQVLAAVLIRGIDAVGYAINLIAIISIGAAYVYISLPVSVFWVINLIIAVWYVGYHIRYFHTRRELFYKTAKELQKEYE
jgi:hypothetical protein